ncbi:MAG: SurA N-terminal domain-containing protein, partial [Pseudomonadota bacterium]
RRAARTWAFRILFAVLIVSFAVWGVGDLSFGGAGTRVASVGEEKVTVEDFANAMIREMRSVSERTGQNLDVDDAQRMGIPDALLARLVRDAALNDEARRLGLSASDANVRDAILASPSFQGLDGTFDQEQYRFILDRLGFEVERFETDLRKSLARDVVARAVTTAVEAPPGLAERLAARAMEQRRFETLTLPLSAAPDPGAPSQSQLEAFHEENAERYERPETREAVWLEITPDALSAGIEIPESELQAAYEAAGDRYRQPERRVADRLVFPDEDAAQAALERIRSGETSFEEEVAARGLEPSDVEAGELTRDDLEAPVAEVLFGADLGVAGPVETSLGPALWNIRAILPPTTTPFEEAREELEDRMARERARDRVLDRAEEVADLLASGATLEAIAEETGLPLKSSDAITREAGAGGESEVGQASEFVEEIFAAAPGELRDLVEVDGGYVLARVDEVREAALRPLSEIRDRVAQDWAEARRREALLETAAGIAERVKAGEPLAAAAQAALPGLSAEPSGTDLIRRDETAPGLPEPAKAELFEAARPGAAAFAAEPQGVAVARLAGIAPADLSEGQAAQLLERWREALDASVGRDLQTYYAAAVQDRLDPSFNRQAMDQAINAIR